ncbi:cation diffusion facilitator family transporter [Mesorhizobium sp. M2A.F.Ca.ET.037.01.1.1]|uniref:cation diffusion facilitator family transporter n=3 Tax=Mesorhizobium TaxID=68287 RepID=UPI000F74D67F|nr:MULTISPECIES: cation diffusion facilitator family transporter [unclassified Mesorhizobium]RVC64221.1 cation diffusion facilitator family transporter [Mesorhizobium sp. M00.F.Ca.ET.038.03.1.1]AZO33136.1 cation transporter [Mesorhizobium sp. M2A.F.Ca.ET.046.03.2.1]RUX09385.1 cation diffusion facilitator family transporter [Mesorhizobium sp. M2A.F.Ca.ET.037.01.1.1]RWA85489.1 MAG: cation diffusion facilitator family transporter [Mesorhizobium sp.]RWB44611.1 MAG: cation diffusion facilitator fam
MLTRILDWFGFGSHGHDHGRHGGHGHDGPHGHTHGVIDATIATTERGIWAIKWSFVILAITAALQLAVVLFSGSVALLADTIHNIADATTAIPLWIAFVLARRGPTRTFTYGLGRVEDLAGIVIVLIILASALVAGYEAIDRLFNPQPVRFLGWLAAAGVIGFLGNEAVAVFRIRVGRQINSAALIADGYHARTDGLTSLAVVAGAVGVWLSYPLADPIIGLLITIAIFGIVWQSARSVLTRMLDGVEPWLVDEVHHAADHVAGIDRVVHARARWLGHKLHVDVEVAVNDGLLLAAANNIAASLKTELFAHIPALDVATVRFAAPEGERGHHHAPDPFLVSGKLASGLLEIVDTPQGERMRLRLSRHAEGLQANVAIERAGGAVESLPLSPVGGDHHYLQSLVAPAEPHEFSARLQLAAGQDSEDLPFAMAEPEGHQHEHAHG